MAERPDPEQVEETLAWFNAWRAAQASFFAWAREEFERRLAEHERDRQRSRVALAREARGRIPFDREGRVDVSARGHRRAKWKFRGKTDRILGALVQRGEQTFGIQGERNRAGIFVGGMTPALRRLAIKRIREALGEAADAAEDSPRA
ncbi:MAG: hypothetical protein KIS92_00870 [Planctomycetota bacterium]|nr:hypothetical protein [Planctomycetota bacterium]